MVWVLVGAVLAIEAAALGLAWPVHAGRRPQSAPPPTATPRESPLFADPQAALAAEPHRTLRQLDVDVPAMLAKVKREAWPSRPGLLERRLLRRHVSAATTRSWPDQTPPGKSQRSIG
jgi:hypothetical protein